MQYDLIMKCSFSYQNNFFIILLGIKSDLIMKCSFGYQ